MPGTLSSRRGRPAIEQQRLQHIDSIFRAIGDFAHPSRLSDSPLCQWDGVRDQAALLPPTLFPRAHVVRRAIRQAYTEALAELGETRDGCSLQALGDALVGLPRGATAAKAGVSETVVSRRRREAAALIADRVIALLQTPATTTTRQITSHEIGEW